MLQCSTTAHKQHTHTHTRTHCCTLRKARDTPTTTAFKVLLFEVFRLLQLCITRAEWPSHVFGCSATRVALVTDGNLSFISPGTHGKPYRQFRLLRFVSKPRRTRCSYVFTFSVWLQRLLECFLLDQVYEWVYWLCCAVLFVLAVSADVVF